MDCVRTIGLDLDLGISLFTRVMFFYGKNSMLWSLASK